MFGFHSRSRSLIPVKDMEKTETTEKTVMHVQATMYEREDFMPSTPRQRRNLTLVYLLFLVEAIMASSLSSQINIILPSATSCLSMNVSFLRSILQCAYYCGNATGILWGLATDKVGRRPTALVGLMGMTLCCMCMAFATTFTSFAILRYFAGVSSSAVTVSGLAMLADSTKGNRVQVVARLPMIAVCGQLGPLLSSSILRLTNEHFSGVFAGNPNLVGQIACASLVFAITSAEALLLDETLPGQTRKHRKQEEHIDCEKAAFLGQTLNDESDDSLNISIIEALNDRDAAATRPSRINITQMLTAPSVLILLASFSILSLHASTFDVLLPHLGHTPTHHGGMGIPCSWLGSVVLVVKVLAALRIMHFVPFIVSRIGLLPVYRRISTVFPVLYLVIPMVAIGITTLDGPTWLSAVVAVLATLFKTTLAGAAHVLVLLLALSAAPDATSTGTLMGVVSISELFKALAVGLSGISYFLSDDYSTLVINASLWSALFVISLVGAGVTWKLRETPRVGTDLPEECFVWQGVFDVESDDEEEVVGF